MIQNGNKTEFAEVIGVDGEFEKVILIDSIMVVGAIFQSLIITLLTRAVRCRENLI